MLGVLTSAEFGAAIIGGLFTLAGTVSTLHMQNRFQKRERTEVAQSFFSDQIRHFKSLIEKIDKHFSERSEIWYSYLDEIKDSYAIVTRNIEHLSFIPSRSDKNAIRRYFSDIYYVSQHAKIHQDKFYEFQRVFQAMPDDKLNEKAALQTDMRLAIQNMKEKVLELKALSLDIPEVIKIR